MTDRQTETEARREVFRTKTKKAGLEVIETGTPHCAGIQGETEVRVRRWQTLRVTEMGETERERGREKRRNSNVERPRWR